MANQRIPRDQTCRVSKGGCGRQVLIVKSPYVKQPFQFAPRDRKFVFLGVHEVSDKMILVENPTPSQFQTGREKIELSCAGKKERGELE